MGKLTSSDDTGEPEPTVLRHRAQHHAYAPSIKFAFLWTRLCARVDQFSPKTISILEGNPCTAKGCSYLWLTAICICQSNKQTPTIENNHLALKELYVASTVSPTRSLTAMWSHVCIMFPDNSRKSSNFQHYRGDGISLGTYVLFIEEK